MKRYFQCDDAAVVVTIAHGELMRARIKMLEARSGVSEPDAVSGFTAYDPLESYTGVAYADSQNFPNTNGVEANSAVGPLWFDAVFDRVFDEGLEDECGNLGVERRGVDGMLDAEPFAKTPLLQGEVTTEKIEFSAQGNFLLVGSVERGSKKFAEIAEHVVRSGGVSVNEGGNGVERVEEEMRIELHLKRGEPGLREACLSREGTALAFSCTP